MHEPRGQDAHEAGKNNQVDGIIAQRGGDCLIKGFATGVIGVLNNLCWNTSFGRALQTERVAAVADNDG